jgi:poly(A) polymerase/tRNA nucleotidyltransferase (CCA-adding enzyme)
MGFLLEEPQMLSNRKAAREAFLKDPVRLIRACRILSVRDKAIPTTLSEEMSAAALQLRNNGMGPSREELLRAGLEIAKILATPKPSAAIQMANTYGILRRYMQPLYFCVHVAQNSYHSDDVLTHCLKTCDALPADKPALRLAGLLHDIGKPITKAESEGKIHFYNHEVDGAALAYKYIKQIGLGYPTAEYVSTLIRHHMFRFEHSPKATTVKRWLLRVKGLHYDLLELRTADRAGNAAKAGKNLITREMVELRTQIDNIFNSHQPLGLRDLKINGEDLKELGLTPGPIFRKILSYLMDKVVEQPELNEKDKLVALAKAYLEVPHGG